MVPEEVSSKVVDYIIEQMKLKNSFDTKKNIRKVINEFLNLFFEELCKGNVIYVNALYKCFIEIRDYNNPDFKKDIYSVMVPHKLFSFNIENKHTKNKLLFIPTPERKQQMLNAINKDKFFKYINTHERNYIYKRGPGNDKLN